MRSDACLTSGRSIQPAAAGHGLARKPAPPGRLLSPRPLVGFGWRGFLRRTLGRGLRVWGWLQRRVEPRQRRAQRIKARGARKSVRLYGMSDCCGYGGELVVGEVNRRHGGSAFPAHRRDARISCESVSSEFDPSARNFSDCVSAAVADADSPGLISLQVPWNGHRESY
jgi:hypothetical protein